MLTIPVTGNSRRIESSSDGKSQAEAELRHSATRLRENVLQQDNVEDRKTLQASLGRVIASASQYVEKAGEVAATSRR